jgi:hypothetical protein
MEKEMESREPRFLTGWQTEALPSDGTMLVKLQYVRDPAEGAKRFAVLLAITAEQMKPLIADLRHAADIARRRKKPAPQ